MKKTFISLFILFICSQLAAQNYQRTSHGIKANINSTSIEIQFFNSKIIRILKYPQGEVPEKKSLSVIKEPENTNFQIQEYNNVITLISSDIIVTLNLKT